MSLNLITEPWIPVVLAGGGTSKIRPDQISDRNVRMLSWPRADLNISCLELLIGLVYLADPPADLSEWKERSTPDTKRLQESLFRYASVFNLGGEKDRFMQDQEPLEKLEKPSKANTPDVLFIDSAGAKTVRENADLFVRRNRYYPAITQELAAMAIYTLQSYAPAGGSGHLTSMRGGGPLVSLMESNDSLWDTVWANVPYGEPQDENALPWVKPRGVGKQNNKIAPPSGNVPVETFFGMPRRLRLRFSDNLVTGVFQRGYGWDYSGWMHPLTPYYQTKAGEEYLPLHPKPGTFGYRQWLGVVIQDKNDELRRQAQSLVNFGERYRATGVGHSAEHPNILVAGWAMVPGQMTPLEYIEARIPRPALDEDNVLVVRGMINAADIFGGLLRSQLNVVLMAHDASMDAKKRKRKNIGKSILEALHEEFFTYTELNFFKRLNEIEQGMEPNEVARRWLKDMQEVAMKLYDEYTMPGLANQPSKKIRTIVKARKELLQQFAGCGKCGAEAYEYLDLDPEENKYDTKEEES